MPAPVATGARPHLASAKLSPGEHQLLQAVKAKHQISTSQALRLMLLHFAVAEV
jgi:hypothetical protein